MCLRNMVFKYRATKIILIFLSRDSILFLTREVKKGEVELGYLLTRIFLSFTNIFNESLKKGIIKSNLSDHLPIFFSISTSKFPQNSSPLKLKKHFFNESNLASSKNQISNINWDILNSNQCSANSLYETFLNIFSEIYDVNFPLNEIEMKPKNLKTSWFSKGLKKYSKTKQRL